MTIKRIPSTTNDELSNSISVVSNAVSNETSNRISADAAVSGQAASIVSVERADRISADNVLSNAISAVSQQLSLQVSALSQKISIVSQALSVEIVDRISADNVLSNAISTLSAAHTSLVDRVSANSATGGGGSVTSAEVVAGDNAVSAQAASIVSVERADRISADNVLSTAISALSQQLSLQVSALSQKISATSQALSIETADRISADNVLSNAISVETVNRIAADNTLSNAISATSQQLSLVASALSVRIDVVSQQISVLSAAGPYLTLQNVDTSAVSAGAPVYAFTSANTFKRADADAGGAIQDVLGLVADSAIAVSATGRVQVTGRIALTTGQWDNITGGTGGLTIGSKYYLDVTAGLLTVTRPTTGVVRPVGIALSTTELQLTLAQVDDVLSALSTLSQAISNEISNRISADNVLSNAISVADAALSVRIDTQSQSISVLSQKISVTSQALSVETANRIAGDDALSNAISALSVQLSLQVSALSQKISATSQALSAEIARAISEESRLSERIDLGGGSNSITSNELSILIAVETSNRISADNALSNSISILSAAHTSLVDRVSANSAAGSGSVTSAEVVAGDNAVSAQAASIVSVERADRISADNLLSTAISAVSQQLSLQVSALSQALSIERVDRISVDTILSNAISATSQQLSLVASALSVRIDTLSQQISVLSAAGPYLTLQNVDTSAVSAGAPVYAFTSANTFKRADADAGGAIQDVLGLVADGAIAVSATGRVQVTGRIVLTTGQWDSITGGTGGLTIGSKYYLDVTAGLLTSTRPTAGVVRPVGIALSTTEMQLTLAQVDDVLSALSTLSQAISNEISNRVSADNALSNAISVLSVQLSLQISAISQAHSALSQAVSVADAALSVRIDTQSQAISVLSQQISVLSQAVSVADAALSARIDTQSQAISVLSQQISVTSQALSAEIVARTTGDSALSTAISAVSQQLSLQVSALSQVISLMSNRLSNLSDRVSVLEQAPGGGSVTSNEVSILIAVETSNRISADNALSDAISILSAAHTSLVNRVSANSGTGGGGSVTSTELSAVSLAAQSALSTETSARIAADDVLSNAISALSVQLSLQISAISQAHSALSQAVSVADAALSVRIDTQSQAISVLSQQISLISQRVSVLEAAAPYITIQNVDTSAVSAGAPVYAFTSANTFKRADADAGGAVRDVLGLVADNSIVVSATGRVQVSGRLTLTTAQWDSVTGQTGGLTIGSKYYLDVTAGMLTQTAPTTGVVRPVGIALSTTEMEIQLSQVDDATSAILAEVSNRISADNVLSNAISALSVQLSLQVSALSQAISAADAALSARIDTVSNAVSVETSARIAADNALSTLISALSQQLSLQISAISQAHSALSQAHSVLSVQVASVQSALSAAKALYRIFTVGGVVLSVNTGATNVIIWRAPTSCTVTNVRGLRVGGTSAVVNARKNGVSSHLATDLNLPTASTWADGGAVQNAAYASGDRLEIMMSISGTAATQIAVQVDFTRDA